MTPLENEPFNYVDCICHNKIQQLVNFQCMKGQE